MTRFLIDRFIKDKDNIYDVDVRKAYGYLSSIVGICINIILFLFKIIIGVISGSIAVISDGFNNLSDCGNAIITIVGYKMASKPADREHPFGHGRIEYILSLVLAFIILIVGYELFKNSFMAIFKESKIVFSYLSLLILCISVLFKMWQGFFNKKLSLKIGSEVLMAVARDSFNDVIATFTTIVSLVFSPYTKLPLDAFMGIIVSGFILKSGYDIIKQSSSVLLGIKPDNEIVDKIKAVIKRHDKILGSHDLMIHSYGPGSQFGSCHIEFDSKINFIEAHEIIDSIEKQIEAETGIIITLHMDPINIDDEKTRDYYRLIKGIIKNIDADNKIHDFRIYKKDGKLILVFDLVVPYNLKLNNNEIVSIIKECLKDTDDEILLEVRIENDYS